MLTNRLNNELLAIEKQNKTLDLSQMTLSHEFRSPLHSCLMILESLLSKVIEETMRNTVLVLIGQINLLLCLVNDILDMKLIDQSAFVSSQEIFNPTDAFKFVLNIFKNTAEM